MVSRGPGGGSGLGLCCNHSRRQYTLTEDGIVERKWAFWTREQTLPYEDIEDLTFTQSRFQSLYGVGTIRINHVETSETGNEEEMRIRYVETPEAVFSAIRSALVDSDASARVDVEPSMQSGSEGASSLTGEGLAAETSSAYLMPIAVLNPRLSSAAFVGGSSVAWSVCFSSPASFSPAD